MRTLMIIMMVTGAAGCMRTGTLSGGPDGHAQAPQSGTCHIKDIQRYLHQIRPEAIESECADHGGSVASIAASETFGRPISDPDHVLGSYSITCANGDVLLANVLMNSTTCDTESVLTSPSQKIWPE